MARSGERQRYDAETRERVTREALLPGAIHAEVASRNGIPLGTVGKWIHEASHGSRPRPAASAWLLCSDWHLGALVEARYMAGRNHYDLDVARDRVARLTEKAVACLHAHGHEYDVQRLNILWAGDIIDGTHAYPGQRYRLQLTTAEAQRSFARSVVVPMLETFATRYSLSCVACEGNHGRATLKEPVEPSDHHELRLFAELARDEGATLAEWSVGHYAAEIECQVTGRYVIVEHGQFVGGSKYGGMTPGTHGHAYARQQDLGRIVDVFAYGHRHTPLADLGGRPAVLCNGSMTGYNEFARGLAFRPCRPAQWCWGLDENGLAWADLLTVADWRSSEAGVAGVHGEASEEAEA